MLTNPTTSIGTAVSCYNKKYRKVNAILVIEVLMELQRTQGEGFEVSQKELLEIAGIEGSTSAVYNVIKELKGDGVLRVDKGRKLATGQKTSNEYTIDYEALASNPQLLWIEGFEHYYPNGVPVIGDVIKCYRPKYRSVKSICLIEYMMNLQTSRVGEIYNESSQKDILKLSGVKCTASTVSKELKRFEQDDILFIRRGKTRLYNIRNGEFTDMIVNKTSQYTVNYKALLNDLSLLWNLDKVDEDSMKAKYELLYDAYRGGNFTTQGLNGKAV